MSSAWFSFINLIWEEKSSSLRKLTRTLPKFLCALKFGWSKRSSIAEPTFRWSTQDATGSAIFFRIADCLSTDGNETLVAYILSSRLTLKKNSWTLTDMLNDRHTMRIAFRVRNGSEEIGQQFAKDHGANYQVAQLQRNRRTRRISVMHAFLPILATIELEFRIFSHKKCLSYQRCYKFLTAKWLRCL